MASTGPGYSIQPHNKSKFGTVKRLKRPTVHRYDATLKRAVPDPHPWNECGSCGLRFTPKGSRLQRQGVPASCISRVGSGQLHTAVITVVPLCRCQSTLCTILDTDVQTVVLLIQAYNVPVHLVHRNGPTFSDS